LSSRPGADTIVLRPVRGRDSSTCIGAAQPATTRTVSVAFCRAQTRSPAQATRTLGRASRRAARRGCRSRWPVRCRSAGSGTTPSPEAGSPAGARGIRRGCTARTFDGSSHGRALVPSRRDRAGRRGATTQAAARAHRALRLLLLQPCRPLWGPAARADRAVAPQPPRPAISASDR